MDDELGDAATIFRLEARRRAQRIEALTQRGIPPRDSPERAELWRHAHSLKGTAGSLGHEEIERLAALLAEPLAPGAPRKDDASDLVPVIAQLEAALALLDQP